MDMTDRKPMLVAESDIGVTVTQARAWFLSLADYPERYQFETHAGFRFTQGRFGQSGARFQTEERFHGVPVVLKFELTEVRATRFDFRLRGPLSAIWGFFELNALSPDVTRLRLGVGADGWAARGVLGLPPVKRAVQAQIAAEVCHIARAMETLYGDTTWTG